MTRHGLQCAHGVLGTEIHDGVMNHIFENIAPEWTDMALIGQVVQKILALSGAIDS